jgi:hypothetical protein
VFYNFTEESDPETLSRLHSKARQDAEWVLKKVRQQQGVQQQPQHGYAAGMAAAAAAAAYAAVAAAKAEKELSGC